MSVENVEAFWKMVDQSRQVIEISIKVGRWGVSGDRKLTSLSETC